MEGGREKKEIGERKSKDRNVGRLDRTKDRDARKGKRTNWRE